jgi:hypothetical protein
MVEKLAVDCLDVRELHRIGIFGDGWITLRPLLRWPAVVKMRAARYLIQLELRNQVVPQQIRVSWTPCHYGGARPWLHCTCGLRVAKLFKGLGGYYCRQCFDNPRYACQSKSTQGRLHFEACKLRLRLGGEASLSAPVPGAATRHASEDLRAAAAPGRAIGGSYLAASEGKGDRLPKLGLLLPPMISK